MGRFGGGVFMPFKMAHQSEKNPHGNFDLIRLQDVLPNNKWLNAGVDLWFLHGFYDILCFSTLEFPKFTFYLKYKFVKFTIHLWHIFLQGANTHSINLAKYTK